MTLIDGYEEQEMKTQVVDLQNNPVGEVELAQEVFGVEVREHLFWEVINWQRAKRSFPPGWKACPIRSRLRPRRSKGSRVISRPWEAAVLLRHPLPIGRTGWRHLTLWASGKRRFLQMGPCGPLSRRWIRKVNPRASV